MTRRVFGFPALLAAIVGVMLNNLRGARLAFIMAAGILCVSEASGQVPLPTDIVIATPDASVPIEVARFSGQWEGRWHSGAAHVLIVEKIEPLPKKNAYKAQLVYAHGQAQSIRTPFYQRVEGTISGGTLATEVKDRSSGILMSVSYRLAEDGKTLNGFYRSSGGFPLVPQYLDGSAQGAFVRATVVPPPVMASTPVPAPSSPAPPTVAQPAPPPIRMPPAITLIDPKPGTFLRTDQTMLKVEVRSDHRLKSLVVKGRDGDKTYAPSAGAKAGDPWTIDVTLPLAEGNNVVRLEAEDEYGIRAAETVILTRQSLIAVEFEGPPGAAVNVDQDHHALDAQGTLTLRLAPGTYQIEAAKEGFIPSRQTLRLNPGQGKATQKLALAQALPPTIAVLDPKPGTVIRTANAKLKVEVRSRYRLSALRLAKEKESAAQTFAPSATAKPGETWAVEIFVPLSEGDNQFTLEAVDEHGTRAQRALTLTRQSLVALELRGPPSAQVKVNNAAHALDAQGALTLQLVPGTYQIEASKDGFTSSRDTVTLAPGQAPTQKRLALAPLPPPAPTIVTPPADTEAPKIAINYPPPDTKVESDSLVVTGLVTDNVGVDRVQIAVNGTEVAQSRDIGVVGRGVQIRVPTGLQLGNNLIEITAADKAGNVAQVVRTVARVAPAVAAPPAPRVANRWAVVIGVGDYEHRAIPKLRFATRDAEAMYQFLTTQGGYAKDHVQLLTDTSATKPTLVNIKRALGDFLARRAGRDDMVLIYFAGHGAPEVDVGGTEADGLSKYLIPRDGDPDSLYTTALPMDEIQKIFTRVQAERVVMLLDTCYSGTAGGRTFARASVRASGLNDQFLERLTRSRGRVIITASGPNEVALEMPSLGHGLFTYYVLEGLRGKADRNGDGLVTVSELYEYVEDQVDVAARLAGGRQRPLMKGEIEGTLPLSRTAP